MVLPGSHLRRINEAAIARYQNFVGQQAMACPAGSLLVCHHGIWHGGQPNLTDRARTMFKLRLVPRRPQQRTWDTTDLDDPAVARILKRDHGWYGHEVRLEIVNRIRLWRAPDRRRPLRRRLLADAHRERPALTKRNCYTQRPSAHRNRNDTAPTGTYAAGPASHL